MKPRSYYDIDLAYSLEHFRKLVESGALTTDDGCIVAVWINGEHMPLILIKDWSHIVTNDPTDYTKLEDLDKQYPNNIIQLEWNQI